jgi:hypothetical protein
MAGMPHWYWLFLRLLRDLRGIQPHELTVLSKNQYEKLLDNLKKVHAAARGYYTPINGTLKIASHPGLTPRIFSRSMVSALEARWFESQGRRRISIESLQEFKRHLTDLSKRLMSDPDEPSREVGTALEKLMIPDYSGRIPRKPSRAFS